MTRKPEYNNDGAPVRFKAAVAVLVVAVGVLGLAYLVRNRTNEVSRNFAPNYSPAAQAATPVPASTITKPASQASTAVETNSPTATVPVPTNSSTIAASSTSNETKIEQLVELGTYDDSASLEAILNELTNSDPEIRAAALEACVQFGSRDAIPRLTQLASQTEDSKERLALTHAAEFLKLPSLTEVLEEKQREQAARGQ